MAQLVMMEQELEQIGNLEEDCARIEQRSEQLHEVALNERWCVLAMSDVSSGVFGESLVALSALQQDHEDSGRLFH